MRETKQSFSPTQSPSERKYASSLLIRSETEIAMETSNNIGLLKRVKEEGFEVEYYPPGDGMCFYTAVSHQLGLSPSIWYITIFQLDKAI